MLVLRLIILLGFSSSLIACSSLKFNDEVAQEKAVKQHLAQVKRSKRTYKKRRKNVKVMRPKFGYSPNISKKSIRKHNKLVHRRTKLKAKKRDFTYRMTVKEKYIRDTASLRKLSSGMYALSNTCRMRLKPTKRSRTTGVLKRGKRIWIDPYSKNWFKVHQRRGHAFVHKTCL